MKRLRPIAISTCVLGILPLTGCLVYPDYLGTEVTHVFPRLDETGRTNQVIIETKSCFAWNSLDPEGGHVLGSWEYKRRYYVKDDNGRRKQISFLRRSYDIPEDLGSAEVCVPVSGTNFWIRVEGPQEGPHTFTNTLILTVFTPTRLLHERTIPLTDRFTGAKSLQFESGNKRVIYRAEHDGFIYEVLENSLKRADQTK